jgi:ubiquinone/menaquinone biosynthesis C-methylase UbiE
LAKLIGARFSLFMPKKIIFNKYQKRAADYHWDQISRNLFRFNAFVSARYKQVVALIPRNNKIRILDIGCGDGVLLGLIGRGQLYGVDPDQDSLDFAAQKIKAKLVRAKAEKLPFGNNFFNVVIATEIIEHLSKPEKLLAEANRVLKSGGRLIMTTPIKSDTLSDRLHVREFEPAELKRLCRRYFKRVKINLSHPLWLKKVYTWSVGLTGKYYFDLGRWLVNGIVLVTGWNPFLYLPGKPTQQLVVCRK